jgi:hypothetical protein
MDIQKVDQGNGTSVWTFDDGTVQIRCNDCNRWHHAGSGTITHAKHCATPQALHLAQSAQPPRSPVERRPPSADGLSSNELLHAWQRKDLTMDQAMNRDF